ncbi:hypothetical protein [Persephonella sp.]
MDKKKLITKIIFGKENLDDVNFPVDENIKDNFEIAWDIAENFEEIKNNMKMLVLKSLFRKLEEVYSDIIIREDSKYKGFLEFKGAKPLHIYFQDWENLYNDIPPLTYALEFYSQSLFFGIRKKSPSIPYIGKIPEDKILKEIQMFYNDKGFLSSDWWLIWRYFKEPYRYFDSKEFYKIILDYEIEYITSYYIEEIKKLVNKTKSYLDEFFQNYR